MSPGLSSKKPKTATKEEMEREQKTLKEKFKIDQTHSKKTTNVENNKPAAEKS